MNKTATTKHSAQQVTKEEELISFEELTLGKNPLHGPQIITNILNYSKALKVRRTESIGAVAHVMN